MSAGPGQR
jgi:hypothetical protein